MRYLLAILLTLGVSYGQTIYVTDQNIFDLVPDRDALTGLAGSQRIKASFWEDPSFTEALDVTAGLPIQLRVSSLVDDYVVSIPNSITSTPPNVVWWVIPVLNAGSYRLQATVNLPGDSFPVFDRYLTLTSTVSAAAVVNLSVTNNISADVTLTNNISVNATSTVSLTSITTNEITVNNYITNITQSTIYTSGVSSISLTGAVDGAITFAGSGVTQTGSVFNFSGGGGSGNITIEGVTTNVFDFVGQFPVTVSNIGNTIYFGQVGGGGTFIPAAGTNQVLNFAGSVTQTFTVPSGVTQLYVYAWGAGGGGGSSTAGGSGGYSFGEFSVTNGEVLTIQIGQGGFISSTTTSTAVSTNTLNPWPNGGQGASKSTVRAGAGGGRTAILRGTNYLVIAGGGGGGTSSGGPGGSGGGTSGDSGGAGGTGAIAGGGGTQTAGGSTGSTAIPLSITNSAGSFGLGGNGGLTTNLVASTAGGGGDGWYGGGGGLAGLGASGPSGGGGGGSGYINYSEGVLGITVRGAGQTPAAQDDPLYGSPTALTWGVGGSFNNSGSNGGLILRWVAP